MEISGKIIASLAVVSGEGKNGQWKSQDHVLETSGEYPKKVCFNLFGDNIDKFPVKIDDEVTVHFNIDSKEYNGRWFTNISAWKVEGFSGTPATTATKPSTKAAPSTSTVAEDDLPF
jgi:hypothetical protein